MLHYINHNSKFETLYKSHYKDICSIAHNRCKDYNQAMDIPQEAFMKLWVKWSNNELILNPIAWLYKVAINSANDYIKSSFRLHGTKSPELMRYIIDPYKSLSTLEREEIYTTVQNAIDKLYPRDREILTMQYRLNYSAECIASKLNINTTAVHMRLSRARKRLADKLKDYTE